MPQPPPDPPTDLPPSPVGAGRDGLGRRSVRSGFARFAEQATVLVLSVGSTAVLARLLTPEDFGLVAMVGVLSGVVVSFKDFGLPMALVHRESVRPEAADALYWLTAGLSGGVCLAMAAGGSALALLFGEPRLVGLTAATAGALWILALGAPQEARLMREMRFGTLSRIGVGAAALGMAVGVGAAWRGLGPWALVVQLLATNTALTAMHWIASGWRPVWRPRTWRHSGLRALAGYGGSYSGFSVVEHFGRRMDRVLVGVVGGTAALGLYDNAFRWSLFPLQQVFTPLLGVAVSGLSRIRHDAPVFRAYVRRSVLPVLAATLPALAFVTVTAEPVVRVLLGDQWLGAIPLLQWMAAAAFLRCFSKVAQWLFLAEGRTRLQLRWGLLSTPLFVVAAVVGVQWGAVGAAAGFFAATAALLGPEMAVALHGSTVRARDLVRAAWRPVVGSVAAGVAVMLAGPWLPGGVFGTLTASAALFGGVYAALWVGLPGGVEATRDVLSLVRTIRPVTPSPVAPG